MKTHDALVAALGERDQLRQQVERLLLAVEDHRERWSLQSTETDHALYAAADQVRKEMGEG